jgi:hypothetical protein
MIRIIGFHDGSIQPRGQTHRRFAKTFAMNKTIIVLAMFFWLGQGTAQTGKMTIHGTSNLHDWETVATEVIVQGKFQAESGSLQSVDQLSVRVPVSKIKSEKGKTMDNKTYESLKSDKHPTITFTASKVTVTGAEVSATGTLQIAGQSKTVTVKGQWKAMGNNEIEITGSHALKMSDYGISAPTALLGTMKTGDGITLKFSVRTKA